MQSVLLNLPVGWRFQPTNEELLDHYLKKKRLGHPIDGLDIQDIQVYDFDPWELLDEKSRDKERYLFCRRQFSLKTGGTRKRKAKAGNWKRTGEIQLITLDDSAEVIGNKKIFVYQDSDSKPTEYVMHEFEYTAKPDWPVQDDNDFVLCKLLIIKKKKGSRKAKANKFEPVSKKKEAKKSKNIQVDYEKANPNKKARKCLSYCDTTSASVAENQKQEKIMANSTFGEGEPSNHKTSDTEHQNPSTRMAYSACGEGEPSNHNPSDFENQNPSDRNAYSACGEGEPSYNYTSEFEYQNPSDRKAYSACGEGKPINHTTSHFEDQSPVPMTMSSICWKGESSHQGVSDYQYQNTYVMIDIPIYNIGDTSFLLVSDLDSQTPKEIIVVSRYSVGNDVSRYSVGETSRLVDADLDNQNPNVMYKLSFEVCNPGCPSSSWVENQNPCEITTVSTHKKGETSSRTKFDFEDDRNQNEVISDSCNGKGKLSYIVTRDFENQNPSEKTNISAFLEGYEKTDMFYEYCWSGSLASGVQETEYQEVAADLDNQNPNEMYMLSHEVHNPGCPSSSWVENQNPCDVTSVSTHKKGETSRLTNFHFEDDRNQNEVISDSCNGKCKRNYIVTWDFENQNPSEKTNISAFVEGYEKTDTSGSLASGIQETETDIPNLDDVDVATFPEIDSQILDELTASDDQLDTLSSEETQPIHSN